MFKLYNKFGIIMGFIALQTTVKIKCQLQTEVDLIDESTTKDDYSSLIPEPTGETKESEEIPTTLYTDLAEQTAQTQEITTDVNTSEANEKSTAPHNQFNDADSTTDVAFQTSITSVTNLIDDFSASTDPTTTPEITTSTISLCGENEVYTCLPLCLRTCNNPVSKIICRPVPSYISTCRRGCTCKKNHLLEKTIKKCVSVCPRKQPL